MDEFVRRVFELSVGNELEAALQHCGIRKLSQLPALQESEIAQLTYRNTKGEERQLLLGVQSYLRNLRKYFLYKTHSSVTIDVAFLQAMTGEDYLQWTRSLEFLSGESFSTSSTYVKAVAGPKKAITKADEFRKGIKRDPALFEVFSKDEVWEEWNRKVTIQAKSQGVANVLNHTYKPSNAEDKELFVLHNQYMYSVFERIIKTQSGIALVRQYPTEDYNAQLVYQALVLEYEKSTRALIVSSDLLEHITNIRLNKWNGKTENFIINFMEKCRQYNDVVDDPSDQISERIQLMLLQNAVSTTSDLAQVKTTNDQLVSADPSKKLSLARYLTLIRSAAVTFDSKVRHNTLGQQALVVSITLRWLTNLRLLTLKSSPLTPTLIPFVPTRLSVLAAPL